MKSLETKYRTHPWVMVALAVALYLAIFPPLRAVVGDVVGAVSAIPVLIAGSLLTRRKVWGIALLMILVNGVMFGITQAAGPSEEWQGAAIGSLSLMITAELVGRVRDKEVRLQRSGASKDRFLAGVSHELRTPLTAVVGYAGLLRESWKNLGEVEREELLDVLHQQAVEVSSIVEDLLVATRLDSDDVTISARVVSISSEVDAVVRSLQVMAGRQVRMDVSRDLEVLADAGRLRQILRNVLVNAIRYGGPRVEVEAFRAGSTVKIAVTDDGAGLPKEEWETIFAPYYRSHRAEGQPDSVGLGLSVSRGLARRMGGDLTYRHTDDKSRFELTLPAAVDDVVEMAFFGEPAPVSG